MFFNRGGGGTKEGERLENLLGGGERRRGETVRVQDKNKLSRGRSNRPVETGQLFKVTFRLIAPFSMSLFFKCLWSLASNYIWKSYFRRGVHVVKINDNTNVFK